jgi:hypothetical protein
VCTSGFAEEVDMARTWEALVREGQEVLRQEENAKWRLGDLALEAIALRPPGRRVPAPDGRGFASEGIGEANQAYADAIGVEYETLDTYRKVAAAWPRGERSPHVSWIVHKVFISRPDRAELIGQRSWTYREAQAEMGHKVSPTSWTPTSPEERTSAAKRLLADPEVRREVFTDPEVTRSVVSDTHTRAALTDASMTVDREREERARSDYELRHGQSLRNEQWARAGVHLDRARNLIIEAGELASDLPEHRRDSLLAQAGAVQAALDWFRVHVKGSDSRLEAELRALIEGNNP